MNHVSLFTGIGGFDLGFERAGMTSTAQIEYDSYPRSVLQRHWPDVSRPSNDVKEVTGHDLGSVDILSGGFPCQDVSLAGQRAGLHDGTRTNLWFEFHRIIAETSPRWIVIENVVGLLSSNNGNDMGTILQGLASLGYEWAYRTVDSQWFGVPQRRRRLFIVGSLGTDACQQALLDSSGMFGDSLSLGTPTSGPSSLDRRSAKRREVTTVHATQTPIVGHNISPTISSQARIAVFGAGSPRFLTPTECERLQGFPDGWTDNLADTRRYQALGNAVTVPVAEWLGRRIVEYQT